MIEYRPTLSARALARLHTCAWFLCAATYIGTFAVNVLGGTSDAWAVGRAVAATLVLAFICRRLLGLLAASRQKTLVEEMSLPNLKNQGQPQDQSGTSDSEISPSDATVAAPTAPPLQTA